MEWPGRCADCREVITDWSEAGFYDGSWLHKTCWSGRFVEAQQEGVELAGLRSPVERGRQLEGPMLLFLLLFHFGLGGAIAGWLMLSQFDTYETSGAIVLAIGLITPLIGIAGAAANIVSRRRIELIRQSLELQGGWKPGR